MEGVGSDAFLVNVKSNSQKAFVVRKNWGFSPAQFEIHGDGTAYTGDV